MRCGNCGKIIADGARFCPHCGRAVDAQPGGARSGRDPGFVSGGFFESGDFDFDGDDTGQDAAAGKSSDIPDRTMSLDDISKILREKSREYEQEYPGSAGGAYSAAGTASGRTDSAFEDYGPDSDDFGLGSEDFGGAGEVFGSQPANPGQGPGQNRGPDVRQGRREQEPAKEDAARGFRAAGSAGAAGFSKGSHVEENRAGRNSAGHGQNAGRASAAHDTGRNRPNRNAGAGNAGRAETLTEETQAGNAENVKSGGAAGEKPVFIAPGPGAGGSGTGSTGGHDRKSPLQLIIILLVILIVAMIGVILFLRLRNADHTAAGTDQPETQENTDTDPETAAEESEPGQETVVEESEPEPEPDPGIVESEPEPEPEPEPEAAGPGPDSGAGILDVFTWDGHTYALVQAGDVNVTDTDAMLDWCRGQGGYAATISSYSELVLLYNRMLEDGVYDAYFGLTSDGGGWYWAGSEASDIVLWGKGAPGGNRINGCAYFDGKVQDGSWQAGAVSSSSRFLCEWEGVNGQYDSAKIVPLISSGSFVYDDHNYAILDMSNYGIDNIDEENTNDDYLGYEALNRFCTVRGGHLAVIYDGQENDFLYSKVRELGAKSAFFGYSDYRSEGSWEWVTGNSSYTNWSTGQPNQTNAMEDYAQFYRETTDGTWNDAPFGVNTTLFIIEWDYSR